MVPKTAEKNGLPGHLHASKGGQSEAGFVLQQASERLQGKSVVVVGSRCSRTVWMNHQDGHAGEQGRRDQLEDDETEQQRKIQRYDDEPQNEHQVNERLDIEGVHRQPCCGG